MNFEDILLEAGGFGLYQWLVFIWFQASIWVMVPNMALMSFAGIKAVMTNITIMNPETNLTETETILCGPSNTLFYSIACQWDLVGPREKIIGYITSSQMAGVFFGPLVVGQISDAIGRRRVFLLFLFLMTSAGFASACSPQWQVFLALRVVLGFSLGALVSVKFILMAEFVVPKWRPIIFVGGWPLGYLFFCLLAYLTSHWRWLIVTSNSFAIIPIIMTILWLDESPKWLMEKKRYIEAREIFEKIARRNGVNSEKLSEVLQNLSDMTFVDADHPASSKVYSYWHLFRTWESAKVTLCLCLSWTVTSFVSYGFLFNIGTFVGHPALNLFIASLIKGGVNGLVSLTDRKVPRIGRRHFHQLGLVILITSLTAMMILYATGTDKIHSTLLLVAAMMGMIFTGMVWMPVEVYTAEIFPTALRNMGNAICGSSARIGSILAPLVSNFKWPPLLYLVMLILCLVNLVIAFCFLPETKGQKLPDLNHDLDAVDLHQSQKPKKLQPLIN